MPTYNSEAFILGAVWSALSQAGVTLEVIIVDDGSMDGTLEIVRGLVRTEPRVRLEAMQQNKGPAAARNRGLAIARGRWIAVLDSDDLFAPGRLRKLIDAAEREGADIVSDNLVEFANDDPASSAVYIQHAKPGWITASDYLRESRLFARGRDYGYLKPVFRADALRAANLKYDERLRIAEDDDLILRALLAGLRYWLEPQETYLYRKHAASTSHRLSVTNARAMCAASADLISEHVNSAELHLLKRRHGALKRGLAFVRLIDALKQKRALTAVGIVLKDPGAIPLLRMPLAAAARRLVPLSQVRSQ